MDVIIMILIGILGINASRFLIGSIALIVKNKTSDTPLPWYMLVLNLLEALMIAAGYIILVVSYYK